MIWSVGLFVATFYGLFDMGNEAFNFTQKELLPIAKSHIMPMVMGMALYLTDVLYGTYLHKNNSDKITWILLMIILFMAFFVFSILVNDNVVGWTLFILAWLSLTVLKYKTTEDGQSIPYKISED